MKLNQFILETFSNLQYFDHYFWYAPDSVFSYYLFIYSWIPFFVSRNISSLAQQCQSTVIRVVHGTQDVHSVIRKICTPDKSKIDAEHTQNTEDTEGNTNETENVLETNANGVWTLSIGSRPFDTNFEGIKVNLLNRFLQVKSSLYNMLDWIYGWLTILIFYNSCPAKFLRI